MSHRPQLNGRLLWVYTGDLATDLDAATWLEATRHLRRFGWRVTLTSFTEGAARSKSTRIRGVPVLALRSPSVWMLGQVMVHAQIIARILRPRTRPDVVLFHEMSALWLLPLRLLGRRCPQLVMDTRTLFMAAESTIDFKDRLRAGYLWAMRELGNRLAHGRLCITPAMAEACRIPPDKLWGQWPSGVSHETFAIAAEGRRWPAAHEPVHLVYVGALHTERCLSNLCVAVARANRQGRRFQLTLVGDGSERRQLERLAARSEGSIRVIPQIAHSAVPHVLQQAHVGTLPFPNEEKFNVSSPIKLFEYLASGLPVLATRIRCHTDVLRNPAYAFWAESSNPSDLESALEQLWSHRLGLARAGAEAARDAWAWTWQASANRLSEALRQHQRRHPASLARGVGKVALQRTRSPQHR